MYVSGMYVSVMYVSKSPAAESAAGVAEGRLGSCDADTEPGTVVDDVWNLNSPLANPASCEPDIPAAGSWISAVPEKPIAGNELKKLSGSREGKGDLGSWRAR